jgi:hypothetical protein
MKKIINKKLLSWKLFLIIIVLVIVVVGGILLLIADKETKGICGPTGTMGEEYNLSYCNKSCITDNNCQFTCGCGAINKNEICHDEGIIYDCVDRYVKCEDGACIDSEEKKDYEIVCNKEKNCCMKNEDCQYIWFAGGCYTPEYIKMIMDRCKNGSGPCPSEAQPRENVTCACENNKCITNN